MQYLFVLGRQPILGLAELEQTFGNVQPFTQHTACLETNLPVDIQALGGSVKAGRVVITLQSTGWQDVKAALLDHYTKQWSGLDRKQTLGISIYDWPVPPKQIQQFGLSLKQSLKRSGVGLRLIPNNETNLNSAVSHHNKLGLSENKTELLIARRGRSVVIAESIGAQNITALAARDQGRPKRDAFVGMLPPKLALLMVNLANVPTGGRILDPFCGTGVVLQEALLRGYKVYGTDLSEKMIDYSKVNLTWLSDRSHTPLSEHHLHVGDATTVSWHTPIDGVVGETYLGQPFSAPPSPAKLEQVKRNCDHIISTFLKNLATQLTSGTPLCLAVPAWRDHAGNITQLNTVSIRSLQQLGYDTVELKSVNKEQLLYFRDDQVVARQLLVLTKV